MACRVSHFDALVLPHGSQSITIGLCLDQSLDTAILPTMSSPVRTDLVPYVNTWSWSFAGILTFSVVDFCCKIIFDHELDVRQRLAGME